MATKVIYTVTVDYDRDPDDSTEAYEVRDDTAEALIQAVGLLCPAHKARVKHVKVHIETVEE